MKSMESEDKITTELPGFSAEIKVENTFEDVNKKLKSSKKGGGFQAMGLSPPVLKGIQKRGYKLPTPIQRKTIPIILEGRDIVAMAKTGSGKTACFLIPLFEKLKQRQIKSSGARALVLSPTRELCIQTFKFIKELGKFLDLKTILVLGGDSMDSQFSAIHDNPDIIVATPGRFLHVCMEMDLKLNAIQYVVFDEADRLFEMGFGEQLNETIRRLPESRQTVLFSATLPKLLVDFAKAGLSDPILLRLDVDSKIPEALELKFLFSRPEERYASLLCLLKFIIPTEAQIVIFAGTQHHVELISNILTKCDITNTFVYSNLDPSARKINTAKFTQQKVNVLVVTDIAARGIDIPNLDYVINFHFPGKPKLFIHRVGRCARAGRSGTAFSIFSTEDEAHMIDLHLFLNRPFDLTNNDSVGVCPPELVEEEQQLVLKLMKDNELANMHRISNNAYKAFIQTRPVASVESNKKVKNIKFNSLKLLSDFAKTHELYSVNKTEENAEDVREDLLSQMRKYKAKTTIFELNPKLNNEQFLMMRDKRKVHEKAIEKFHKKMEELENDEKFNIIERSEGDESEDDDEESGNKKRKRKKRKAKVLEPSEFRDKDHYISYQPNDQVTESGLAINSFTKDAQQAEFSVTADTMETMKLGKTLRKWDRKKKKMVNVEDPRAGKIRTEHGVWIPASYKTDRYAKWRERTKIDDHLEREIESEDDDANVKPAVRRGHPHTHWGRHNAKLDMKKMRDPELKSAEQVMKRRARLEKIKNRELASKHRNEQKRKRSLAKQKKKAKKN